MEGDKGRIEVNNEKYRNGFKNRVWYVAYIKRNKVQESIRQK